MFANSRTGSSESVWCVALVSAKSGPRGKQPPRTGGALKSFSHSVEVEREEHRCTWPTVLLSLSFAKCLCHAFRSRVSTKLSVPRSPKVSENDRVWLKAAGTGAAGVAPAAVSDRLPNAAPPATARTALTHPEGTGSC